MSHQKSKACQDKLDYDKIDFDPLFDVPTKTDFPVILKSSEVAEFIHKVDKK